MSMRDWYVRKFDWVPRPVRKVIVLVIGGTVFLLVPIGILLPIMPGWIFLPLALAILALEFAWAARWLLKIRNAARKVKQKVSGGFSGGEQGRWPARILWRCRQITVRKQIDSREAPAIAAPPPDGTPNGQEDFSNR